MFRFIKPRATNVRARLTPNVFSTSTLPMRLNAQRHASSSASDIQVVRFKKPPFNPKNAAITIIVAIASFEIYTRLVLAPFDKAAEEASKHIPEEEWQEAAQPLFIPFPGTTKELPAFPYKGTDPEFQEFMRISKDAELLQKLRVDLAEFMRDFASKTPGIVRFAGKNMKTRRLWLDIDFPKFPPPTFERSGLEITDDTISWVVAPVEASLVYKIRNVLWPTAVFQSSWSFFKVLAAEEFRSIAGKFGVEVQATPTQQSIDQILARSQKWVKETRELNGQQKVAGGVQRPLTTKDLPPRNTLGDKSKEIGDAAAPGKPNVKEEILPILTYTFQDLHSSLAKSLIAAKIKYVEITRRLRPRQNLPPRGSVKVSGFVELEAEKAFLVFDVIAAWDPKREDFDLSSMQLILRRIQKKVQVPVNG
ncbi:hypothetical protein NHQ30_002619 [Ciborinia camelliae]|nr:hypothetical protein NHQ30_002619 [Ciborinia camelliae]